MATLNVPPSDIAPAEFFENWFPAEYRRLRADLPAVPPDAVITVELSGDGGGAWSLTMNGGELSVVKSAADNANITIRQSVEDWRLVTTQAADNGAHPAAGAALDKLLTSPALGQVLSATSGTIRIEIAGLAGRDFATEIVFAGAAAPSSTVKVSAETLEQIRSGALAPPAAFFSGQIEIVGDPTLAMQVGMAFMS